MQQQASIGEKVGQRRFLVVPLKYSREFNYIWQRKWLNMFVKPDTIQNVYLRIMVDIFTSSYFFIAICFPLFLLFRLVSISFDLNFFLSFLLLPCCVWFTAFNSWCCFFFFILYTYRLYVHDLKLSSSFTSEYKRYEKRNVIKLVPVNIEDNVVF